MPDKTTEAPEVKYMIERNEIKMPFVIVEKTRGDEKPAVDPKTGKEDNITLLKGEKYPAPWVTEKNLLEWVKWLGADVAVAKIQAFLNAWAQRIMESTKEQNNGEFNETTWLQFAPELSFRGEPLKELRLQMMEEVGKLSEIETLEDGFTPASPEAAEKFKAVKARLAKLKALIKDKERSPRETKEAGDPTPSNN